MTGACTVYWPQQRWKRAAPARTPLTVLFGGPHQSEPGFRRSTVQPGDLLYPIGVRDQVLYVFGRMRAQQINPPESDDQQSRLSHYLAPYPQWRFLAPACTSEVVIGSQGTAIHLDRPVTGEILKRLTYRPRRGPRPIKHVSDDGYLLHVLSVRGIYRLAESSAGELKAVLTRPPGEPITRPPGARAKTHPRP